LSIEVDQHRTFQTRCKFFLLRALHEGILGAPKPRPLVVLTTSRSGSTWLCDVLSRASHCGPIAEHLRPKHFEALVQHRSSWPDLQEALGDITLLLEQRTFGGTKIIWDYFPDLEEKFPDGSLQSAFDQLFASNPIIVRLQRQDRAKQAISRYIASQTGVYHRLERPKWRRARAPKLQPSVSAGNLDYDFESILHHYKILTRAETNLDNFISSIPYDFVSLRYEETRGEPIASMLEPLGLMLAGVPSQANLKKRLGAALEKSTFRATKTERSSLWHQNFLDDMKKHKR
jgi:LPS sulfotransferase NodH